MIFMN